MKHKARKAIEKYKMLNCGERVVVGVSGGADSTALSFFLKHEGYEVIACHINHNLRGEESDRDEKFVREYCRKHNIKLNVISVDVKTMAREKKESIEVTARRVRYEFFAECAYGCKIATAHTLSDSMETIVLQLTRGTGSTGMCGIPPVRGDIVRPLIQCTREEIERYCNENGVEYITDSTNLTKDYTRNKIRHDIIPVLYKINENLDKVMLRGIEIAIEEEEYFSKITKNFFQSDYQRFDREKYILLHSYIREKILIAMMRTNSIPYDRVRIELIDKFIESGTGAVQVSGQAIIKIKRDIVFIKWL